MSEALNLPTVLREGDPRLVAELIAQGILFDFKDENGYTALLHAVHGRDVAGDPRLLDLLRVLVGAGVELNAITRFNESGLRVLSHIGRFDAVGYLLSVGADESQLAWTPLIKAVALGSVDEVEELIREGAALEATDYWRRTAWLVSLAAGDLAKATLLRDRGANVDARGGFVAEPPLLFAIGSHQAEPVQWLIDSGQDIEQMNGFGTTPLMFAVERGDLACVRLLITAGANVNAENGGGHVLHSAVSKEIVQSLLDAGAHPRYLSQDGYRALCGLGPAPLIVSGVTEAEFRRAPTRRFGTTNPERMNEPFWEAMIRCGASAYAARTAFGVEPSASSEPLWSANRFGQSITQLPDGRVIQIAGEHEDHYDPDFCIYNDVFVHGPNGSVSIYGYPEDVFPPTDFHSATLVDDVIYVIGSLGYHGRRRFEHTPVYRLDLATFRIEEVRTWGSNPGWIFEHNAARFGRDEIRVSGGKVAAQQDGKEDHEANPDVFLLNVRTNVWQREPRIAH